MNQTLITVKRNKNGSLLTPLPPGSHFEYYAQVIVVSERLVLLNQEEIDGMTPADLETYVQHKGDVHGEDL